MSATLPGIVAKAIGRWIARPCWCWRCAGETEALILRETFLAQDHEGYRSIERTRRTPYARCLGCGWLTPRRVGRYPAISVELPQ